MDKFEIASEIAKVFNFHKSINVKHTLGTNVIELEDGREFIVTVEEVRY